MLTTSAAAGRGVDQGGVFVRATRSPRTGPFLVAAGAFVAVGYVGLVDPNTPGHFPLCPFKALTGLDCPGCGGLRATYALVHGDIGAAMDQNLFAVLVFAPLALLLFAGWFLRTWRNEPQKSPRSPRSEARTRWLGYSFLIAMLVFTVARNIPAIPYLRSGIG